MRFTGQGFFWSGRWLRRLVEIIAKRWRCVSSGYHVWRIHPGALMQRSNGPFIGRCMHCGAKAVKSASEWRHHASTHEEDWIRE